MSNSIVVHVRFGGPLEVRARMIVSDFHRVLPRKQVRIEAESQAGSAGGIMAPKKRAFVGLGQAEQAESVRVRCDDVFRPGVVSMGRFFWGRADTWRAIVNVVQLGKS